MSRPSSSLMMLAATIPSISLITLAMTIATAGVTLFSSRADAGLPYGPDTCRQGYVWREAIPSDHVCVTPGTRAQTAYDNSQASFRRNPTGPYGSDTCIQGYVWREAFANDHVCVTPQVRAQAAYDNSQAASRRATASVPFDHGTKLNPVRE